MVVSSRQPSKLGDKYAARQGLTASVIQKRSPSGPYLLVEGDVHQIVQAQEAKAPCQPNHLHKSVVAIAGPLQGDKIPRHGRE